MRRYGRFMVAAAACLGGTAAQAADKPLYQPVPAWVKPAPAIDAATLKDDAPIYLTLDTQERLQDGTVWSYHDVATRMASTEVVQQAGTVTLPWQPTKGDLIVHRLEIIRGGQHIDVLAGGKTFTVIRREQQLERYSIDGELTATLPVEGLQVGDVLHLTFTVSNREESLGGAVQDVAVLAADPLRVGFARTRLLWPAKSDIRWKSPAAPDAVTLATAGGEREVSIKGVLPKAPDLPGDAPQRYQRLALVEATSFPDWAAVSKVMAPYYATDGLIKPGDDLAQQVVAIKTAQTDPLHRADAALELVQGKVRYLFNGLDKGNYVPQTPEQTWALKYGDCKAKTVLLLAILHAMDIDAEPVLANLVYPDRIPERLASAAAFNHVLVRATIAGQVYWLDGTGAGARFADIGDVPPLRWVLPIRAAGSGLMAVPAKAPALPLYVIHLDIDQRAGVRIASLIHVTMVAHGQLGEAIGLIKVQGSKDQKEKMTNGVMTKVVGGDAVVTSYTMDFDAAKAVGTIDLVGTATDLWKKVDDRYRLTIDKTLSDLTFEPDRERPAWQTISVATGRPDTEQVSVEVHLPDDGKNYALDGDTSIGEPLISTRVVRTVAQKPGEIALQDLVYSSGAEIAPGEVPAMRTRVASAKTRALTVVAPADLDPLWKTVRADRANGRLKPILAAYSDSIANDPTEPAWYDNRASFLSNVFEWKAALPDYDKAISLSPTATRYLDRAYVERVTGADAKALADMQAAVRLSPGSVYAVSQLGSYMVDHGQTEGALALAQQQIDKGGTAKAEFIARKADFLARSGNKDGAMTTIDQAIAAKPGDPDLLNDRCWLKGQLNVQLETALKDCTKAIELADSSSSILDSRALAYFRMNRYDDALADLDAALAQNPSQTGSLYLRGIIRKRQGKTAEAAQDLDAATFMSPLIAENYKPFGIVP